jgi:hypothetical protein
MQPEKKRIRKEVGVLYIEPKKLDEYWNLVEFMLREGLKYDGDPMDITDLHEGQSIWCLCNKSSGVTKL